MSATISEIENTIDECKVAHTTNVHVHTDYALGYVQMLKSLLPLYNVTSAFTV